MYGNPRTLIISPTTIASKKQNYLFENQKAINVEVKIDPVRTVGN